MVNLNPTKKCCYKDTCCSGIHDQKVQVYLFPLNITWKPDPAPHRVFSTECQDTQDTICYLLKHAQFRKMDWKPCVGFAAKNVFFFQQQKSVHLFYLFHLFHFFAWKTLPEIPETFDGRTLKALFYILPFDVYCYLFILLSVYLFFFWSFNLCVFLFSYLTKVPTNWHIEEMLANVNSCKLKVTM